MKEEWRPVKGYEGFYEVSSIGSVRSVTRIDALGRIRKQKQLSVNHKKDGYLAVRLCRNGTSSDFTVHRLVAGAFIPNENDLKCVNHKDENKSNNAVENLEWCDHAYNNNYGTANYRQARTKGKKVEQRTLTGEFVCDFYSIAEASRRTGFSVGAICNGVNKKTPTNKFIWAETSEVKVYA